jgi:hypothetical protein
VLHRRGGSFYCVWLKDICKGSICCTCQMQEAIVRRPFPTVLAQNSRYTDHTQSVGSFAFSTAMGR